MNGAEVQIRDKTSRFDGMVGRIVKVQKTLQGNDLYIVAMNPFISESFFPDEVFVLDDPIKN
jgi:hypothetical protein